MSLAPQNRYRVTPRCMRFALGRLAVDEAFKSKGLGKALLADAFERTIRSDIAAFFVLFDAKDEAAAGFYDRHGRQLLTPWGLIFLPLAIAQGLIN